MPKAPDSRIIKSVVPVRPEHRCGGSVSTEASHSGLDYLSGAWCYNGKYDTVNVDVSLAGILGIKNYKRRIPAGEFESYLLNNDVYRIKQCLRGTDKGDVVSDIVTVVSGINSGKRFRLQGKVIKRDAEGRAVRAMGTMSHENSPYSLSIAREIAGNGMFMWDKQSGEVVSNAAMHKLLGYTRNKFPHTVNRFLEQIHPDDNDVLSLLGHIAAGPQYGDIYECCVRMRKADNSYLWVICKIVVTERNKKGRAVRLIGSVTNIDMLQENFDNLKLLMFTDPLTGLHNRTFFHQNQLRYEDPALAPVSVVFVDVSGLKVTNDILGHNHGDYLLLKTGQILQNALQSLIKDENSSPALEKLLKEHRAHLGERSRKLLFAQSDTQQQRQNDDSSNDYLSYSSHGSNLMSDGSYGHSGPDAENAINQEMSIHAEKVRLKKTDNTMQHMYAVHTHHTVDEPIPPELIDCLDTPEGCLIHEEILNDPVDTAMPGILNLPADLLGDLASFGVTAVSAEQAQKEQIEDTDHKENNDSSIRREIESIRQSISNNDYDALIEAAPEILRLGGDEFLVLIPKCDEVRLHNLKKRIITIREIIVQSNAKLPIDQRPAPVCFGIGCATVGEEHNDTFLQTVQRADYRMQINKEKYHDENYRLLQSFFEEKLKRTVSMRDERRVHILSQKEREKLRMQIRDLKNDTQTEQERNAETEQSITTEQNAEPHVPEQSQ